MENKKGLKLSAGGERGLMHNHVGTALIWTPFGICTQIGNLGQSNMSCFIDVLIPVCPDRRGSIGSYKSGHLTNRDTFLCLNSVLIILSLHHDYIIMYLSYPGTDMRARKPV